MNRKLMTIALVALAVVSGGVIFAAYRLYNGTDVFDDQKLLSVMRGESPYSLCVSVPATASAVAHFEHLATLAAVVTSPSFETVAVKKNNSAFYSLLSLENLPHSSAEALVSLHYGNTMSPLLVVDAGKASSVSPEAQTLKDIAVEMGLVAEIYNCSGKCSSQWAISKKNLLFISPSQALISSAIRHIETESNISVNDGFLLAASRCKAENYFMVQSSHIGKLLKNVDLFKSLNPELEFFKKASTWTCFSLDSAPGVFPVNLGAIFVSARGHGDFASLSSDLAAVSSSDIYNVIPSDAGFVFTAHARSWKEWSEFVDSWREYAGSSLQMEAFRAQVKKNLKYDPLSVGSKLDLKSVAYVDCSGDKLLVLGVSSTDDKIEDALSKADTDGIASFPYPTLASSGFGRFFSLQARNKDLISNGSEQFFISIGDYLIVSGKASLRRYIQSLTLRGTLSQAVPELSSLKKFNFSTYYAESPTERLVVYNLSPGLELKALYVNGSALVNPTEGATEKKSAEKKSSKKSKQGASLTIAVPTGPFEVKNSATGKMNTLLQDPSDFSLRLLDENGVQQWKIAFGGAICGRVQTIDKLKNGKLQFLFASGSKLYLYDRLGHSVSGFPLDLGSPVALGPDVYDFKSNRNYNFIILHTDGSVQMYNMQGGKPAKWQGIVPPTGLSAISLPTREKVGDKSVWRLPLSDGSFADYPFYGGEPLEVK